jgi:serine/threonine protein phosphatase 1
MRCPLLLIVGDIHGCHAELCDLADRAGLGAADPILAVGDLVDRGPDARAVFDFFRRRPGAGSILGNHERKHLRWSRGELEPALSQRIARVLLADEYPAFLTYAGGLPLYRELPEALVVHGFWEPGVPLERQRATVLAGTLSGEQYLRDHYPEPWYERYDGPRPLVVGHRDYRRDGQPLVWRDRVFGLDTGCVHGGRLTGLLLPDFRLVSVPARADHWQTVRARYALPLGPLMRPGQLDR